MKNLTAEKLLEVVGELEASRKSYLQSFTGLPIILNPTLPPNAIHIHVGRSVYAELMKFPTQ